jgi:glycosyltransferase involved in cell wall biosynthesis
VIKVLYLRSAFNPGGIEILLLNLFNHPQDRIQFHFVILKNSDLIRQFNSSTNKYYKYFRNHYIDVSVLKSILSLIRKEHIQLIHTHQLLELFYALIIKVFSPKLKIYHTIHGVYTHKWYSTIEKILIRYTEITFTVSKSAKEILVKKGYSTNKIEVLYNAVKIPEPVSEYEKKAFYHSIGYNKGDVLIGMIGNFVAEKDQFTLVRAFSSLQFKHPNLRLILIGKEHLESVDCKRYISEQKVSNVYLLGAINNANKYLYLFDLFVLSSKSETFSIGLFEALLAKIPVIASDIPVFKELSENGRYFTLFKTRDAANLTETIEHFLLLNINSELIENINSSFIYAKTSFGFDNYINNLFVYYTL